jgi:bifunctional non-homologous end joining protein LigD
MASPPKRKLAEYRRKRDFTRTPEPSGSGTTGKPARALRFVIQKHAASHLHFDFRLELDGVMKSWAVPKGPSLDPAVKRLAMEVEDHPIDYNTFEGTIPKGQYGGGTVMLWDRGTYTADESTGSDESTLRREYAAGKMSFTLHGERLQGSFALIRTRATSGKPQWLLMKHRDAHARPGSDVVAEIVTSVDSGRTMDAIATGRSRVWQSNRGETRTSRARTLDSSRTKADPSTSQTPVVKAKPARAPSKRAVSSTALEPMYASIGTDIPPGEGWTYEPKYDGIRLLAFVTPRSVKLMTRNGNDKTRQFPEVVEALKGFGESVERPLVLDGEVVALINGKPGRFQELQGRMHVKEASTAAGHAERTPAAFVAFDLLLDGDDVLLHEPWSTRRKRLERLWGRRKRQTLMLTESVEGDGEAMVQRARRDGWEGVIAKRVDALYEPGIRSRAWLKLKIEHRQEFVIGGYTEPRNTREHIGALLLGYFDNDRFIYVGHTGGGFTRAGLREMYERLVKLERRSSPFEETPKTNERAHWVTPRIVVEVKFNEWTADGKLRQPIFLGVRDDKDAKDVGREPESIASNAAGSSPKRRSKARSGARARSGSVRRATAGVPKGSRATARKKTTPAKKSAVRSRTSGSSASGKAGARGTKSTAGRTTRAAPSNGKQLDAIIAQLDDIERSGGSGTLTLDAGQSLAVSSLGKVFFPRDGITKGDLMRFYVLVSPFLLPAIADRPLVLKRFPNGIEGPSFYQQNASDDLPDVVRVETIRNEKNEEQRRIIGGDLATLLYLVQLGAISVDPWHARVGALEYADYTILDLDPGPRATFARVVEVARWVRQELETLGLSGIAKTSGSSGIHIYVPLPDRTTEETALLVAQLIATRVADAHPREATIERSVKARPPAAVYVDYLQNIRAKTVAGVYSVRAKPGATVSTPLAWKELTPALDPRSFTISTVPARVRRSGDLWLPAMRSRNTLRGVLEAANSTTSARKRGGTRVRKSR